MTSNDYLQHHGVLGQKWGVRRYQNKDGSLTEAGKKRYERDIQSNLSKKKDNRIDTSKPDPKRWSIEDTERKKKIVDASRDMVRELKNIENSTSPKSTRKTMDLSNMTDKELRDRINRKRLEINFEQLFSEVSPAEISEGRQIVKDFLDMSGDVLAVTSSAFAIALAIKSLKS